MNDYEYDSLPELPLRLFERHATLKINGVAPVLTNVPNPVDPPDPPPTPQDIPLGSTYKRTYLTQVTYPKLVCYERGHLIQEVAWRANTYSDRGPGDASSAASDVKMYKLTGLTDERFKFGYFCTVHYGPFSAIVVENGPCIEGQSPRWELTVPSIPGLFLIWYGQWQDLPSYPDLHVLQSDLYLHKEEFSCCPGYTFCVHTGACLQDTIECKEPIPV